MADHTSRCRDAGASSVPSWWSALLVGLGLLLMGLGTASAEDLSPQEIARLLAHTTSGVAEPEGAAADARLADKLGSVARGDAAWPLYTFLRGELLLQLQRAKPAAEVYRSVVEHAASNPYKDTWGGNGLTAFALYRWLQLHAASGSTERAPFEEMAAWADSVLETRLVRSAFRPFSILSSMPLLEEELYYALATEALRVGASKRAATYFLGYLTRMRSKGLAPESDPLYAVLLEQGISTPHRIALLRGKRLVSLNETTAALPYLETAAHSTHDQTRLEALYLRARAARKTMSRTERSAIYEQVHRYSTNDELAQSALLSEGLLFGPKEPGFANILGRVVREYPSGSRADEALYWLAWGARITGDLEGALSWQGKLRERYGQSPYLSRVAIHTALAYIWRGRPEDLDTASGVLTGLLDQQPNTDERPRALFWLGRIAEQQGREAEARKRFEDTAKADFFDYYGLRARMHLASGSTARSQLLIEDPTLAGEIRAAYKVLGATAPSAGLGVYRQRLEAALGNGLYRLGLGAEDSLRRAAPSKRVQEMTFDELDHVGFLAPIAVTIALRQDALAAADSDASLQGRLALARQLGANAGDWPVLLSLVHPALVRPAAKHAELMREPGYLRVAYPLVFEPLIREASTRQHVAPALLYAIMRQESFFYTAALSPSHALGLFQFTPNTFDTLDREWGLLAGGAASDRAAYLMNERLSIELGARWFAKKKLPVFGNNLLLAILAHHSGDNRVKKWNAVWNEHGWSDDVETMIESFRMHDFIPEADEDWGIEARDFARHVMTDIAIVDALGLYADRPR